MRSLVFLLIGTTMIFSILGCKPTEGDNIDRNKEVQVSFKVLEENNIPDKIIDWVEENKEYEQALLVDDEQKFFAVVTRGLQNTGGYAVEIKDMNLHLVDGETTLQVEVEYIDPKPDAMVTQAITYPFAVAEITLDTKPEKVEFNIDKKNP